MKTKIGVSLFEGVYSVIVEKDTRQYGRVREVVKTFNRREGYTRRSAEDFAFGVGAGLKLAGRNPESGVYEW